MKACGFKSAVSLIAFLALNAFAATHYVDLNSANPTPPYTDWSTAATNIQDAVDVATNGDLVLVTNGIYQSVGRSAPDGSPTSVVVTKAVTLQSVNGAVATLIDGISTMRCVYLTNGTSLLGFTLSNGTAGFGGGVYCASTSVLVPNADVLVANCLLFNNSAGFSGGGASTVTLSNCTFSGNSADGGGGAAYSVLNNCILTNNSSDIAAAVYSCMVTNCTIIGNSGGYGSIGGTLANCLLSDNNVYDAVSGGGTLINCTVVGNMNGIVDCVASNCIVYGNDAQGGANYTSENELGTLVLKYCCTTPDPGGFNGSIGNITNEPAFVDLANGDFHLQSNSPCINAGNNSYITNATDLDGNPRIVGGTVDIGAYEYQTPSSILSYAWAQQYGLPTDGSADYADSDGDGMNNWQEWRSGTNPTNSLSLLKMYSLPATNNLSGITVSWQSVGNVTYFLQSSTNLAVQPPFSTIQSNIIGQDGVTTYVDSSATNDVPYFYRVGVQ
ncbi:MAG TPA: right-handed parallel beta-helix repeat-containing protein [Verrucomicrobiae bacterium]|nr:right-handed parallel beta-helix repeat-containing protein [Verrucomicrobiae bacterium]